MISNKKIVDCPVATTINLIGNKWKLLIIRDLLSGTKRFSELRKNLTGISQRVLTENLRNLENDGLIDREVLRKFRLESNIVLIKQGYLYNQ